MKIMTAIEYNFLPMSFEYSFLYDSFPALLGKYPKEMNNSLKKIKKKKDFKAS